MSTASLQAYWIFNNAICLPRKRAQRSLHRRAVGSRVVLEVGSRAGDDTEQAGQSFPPRSIPKLETPADGSGLGCDRQGGHLCGFRHQSGAMERRRKCWADIKWPWHAVRWKPETYFPLTYKSLVQIQATTVYSWNSEDRRNHTAPLVPSILLIGKLRPQVHSISGVIQLISGQAVSTLAYFQSTPYSATERMFYKKKKKNPLLKIFQWLSSSVRIKCNLFSHCYSSLHNMIPALLSHFIFHYAASRSLASNWPFICSPNVPHSLTSGSVLADFSDWKQPQIFKSLVPSLWGLNSGKPSQPLPSIFLS